MERRGLRLGVDIGRVIIDEVVKTPPVAHVFDVLPDLVERFDGRAWLVSKCGERVQQRTLAWLDHHDFYGDSLLAARHHRLR